MVQMDEKSLLKLFVDDLSSNRIDYNSIAKQSGETKEDAEMIFRAMHEEKTGSIKEVIDEIKTLIEQREALNKSMIQSIEQVKISIKDTLSGLSTKQHTKEAIELTKKIVELDQTKLEEELNKWRDIAELKRELRERLKEFREKESRMTMLDTILTK